jgi:hypothetical protein
MVLLLGADVAPDLLDPGFANRERPVTLLPVERLLAIWQLVDPSRGASLDLLDQVRDREARLGPH